MFEPEYISLYQSGELERRAKALEARLASCNICPRECGSNRLEGEYGFCHSGRLPIVVAVCPHYGEEPAISGSRGSGAIFLGNCNMKCAYCQNYQISQDWKKQQTKVMDFHTLAERMLYLQDELGCHNINFVSPSHFVPQLPPLKPFGNQARYSACLLAAISISLALWNRHTSGRGQHIDVSMEECVAATLDHISAVGDAGGVA